MVKKNKIRTAGSKKSLNVFDPEKSNWFVPVVFLFLFLAVTFLFSDFLFSDKMLYGSDTIQAGIYMRSLLVDQVKADGSIPQWSPYIFGGMPYVEAFHGDIFYPFSILKFFMSLFRALGINLYFHIFFHLLLHSYTLI